MKTQAARIAALLGVTVAVAACDAGSARRADDDVYAAYAAALDSFPALRAGSRPVSARTGAYPLSRRFGDTSDFYRALQADTGVGPALVLSFDSANAHASSLCDCFPPGSHVTLVPDTLRAGEAGPLRLSGVAFSPDRSRALVEVGYACGPLCAQSALYLVTRRAGRWRVSRTVLSGST